MNLKFSALAATLLLSSTLLLESGCKKSPPPPQTQVGVHNSDGSITNPDGSVTYPAGVMPPRGAPVSAPTTAPANSPQAVASTATGPAPIQQAPPPNTMQSAPIQPISAPAPVALTVPAGTPVTVRITEALSASHNDVGDRFTGVLDRPLVSHGSTVFASGTAVSGEVVAAKGKGRFKGAGDLGIELTAIGREHVSTSVYEKVGKGRGKRTAGFIGGGGGLGAIIGGIAGGGKGALIGGLAGAGAGTAAGAYTGNRDVVIPSESIITFRLRSSLTR